MGPRAGLDRCGKSSPPQGFDPRIVQQVASRYTDLAIPTHRLQQYKIILFRIPHVVQPFNIRMHKFLHTSCSHVRILVGRGATRIKLHTDNP